MSSSCDEAVGSKLDNAGEQTFQTLLLLGGRRREKQSSVSRSSYDACFQCGRARCWSRSDGQENVTVPCVQRTVGDEAQMVVRWLWRRRRLMSKTRLMVRGGKDDGNSEEEGGKVVKMRLESEEA